MTSYSTRAPYQYDTDSGGGGSGALAMVIAVFLGIAVAVLATVSVILVKTADDARDQAKAATAGHTSASNGAITMPMSLPLQSFAGETAANERTSRWRTPRRTRRFPRCPRGTSCRST